MDSRPHCLRVALIFNGTIYDERVFSQTSDPVVTMGDDDSNVFSLVASGLPNSLEVFERHDRGYILQFTDAVDLSLHLNGGEFDLEDLIDDHRAAHIGEVDTGDGPAALYELNLHVGDWGIIDLGRNSVYFQLMNPSDVVAGRRPGEIFDGPLVTALMIAFFLHAAFLVATFLQFEEAQLDRIAPEDRWAEFDVDDVQDAREDEEEKMEDDDDAAGAAAEEPQEVDEPDDESEAAETAELEEQPQADEEEVDDADIGLGGILSEDVLGDGMESLLADDGRMDEIMLTMDGAGDGVERGSRIGRGPMLGDGDGGGDGRLGTVGTLDTGTGDGPPGDVGEGTASPVGPPEIDDDDIDVGGFCEPADIRRVIETRANRIQHCYERQLQTNPELTGNVTVNWRIELDGTVSRATVPASTIDSIRVEQCIVRQIERMQFAEPDGGMCEVDFPFVFTGR